MGRECVNLFRGYPLTTILSNIATLQQDNTVVLYNTHILLKDPFHSYYNRLNCTENKIGYLMLTRTPPKYIIVKGQQLRNLQLYVIHAQNQSTPDNRK